jgi:hypothetical protein
LEELIRCERCGVELGTKMKALQRLHEQFHQRLDERERAKGAR